MPPPTVPPPTIATLTALAAIEAEAARWTALRGAGAKPPSSHAVLCPARQSRKSDRSAMGKHKFIDVACERAQVRSHVWGFADRKQSRFRN